MHVTKDQSLTFSIGSLCRTVVSGESVDMWDPKEV